MTLYAVIELGQYWFRYRLVAWRPDGNKPLPKALLSCHQIQWSAMVFARGKFTGCVNITVASHECFGVLNHWQFSCMFKHLFRLATKKYQSSALLVFVMGVLWRSLDFPLEVPKIRKWFPHHNIIIIMRNIKTHREAQNLCILYSVHSVYCVY